MAAGGQPGKPPAGSRVNFGHPLAGGLHALWLCNERGGQLLFDAAQHWHTPQPAAGVLSWPLGQGNGQITQDYRARAGWDGTCTYSFGDNEAFSMGDIPFAVGVRGTFTAGGVSQYILSKAGSAAFEWWLELASTNKFIFNVSDNGTNLTQVLSAVITTGTYTVIAWHDPSANVIGINVNGVETTAAHTTGVATNQALNFRISGISAGTAGTKIANGTTTDWIAIWKYRLLSQEDRRDIVNNGISQVIQPSMIDLSLPTIAVASLGWGQLLGMKRNRVVMQP